MFDSRIKVEKFLGDFLNWLGISPTTYLGLVLGTLFRSFPVWDVVEEKI
ncbi:hypothetical protein CK203_013821 [Vitis vinifera]|uniref:Uncharacterized protein n=1 Tax=Vitis vinifera TaxID=29760 RepID=A0A438JJL8_VITVI|nr:hypothetical protein CK203_013821 [Vitis vinifera]